MNDDAQAMASYYARRAGEYERVYTHKPERQADLRAIEAWLPTLFDGRAVLEVACGTGWWTPHAARHARAWLATDVNDETLAIARSKPLPPCVQMQRLDAMALDRWAPGRRFGAAFAGFWWSHLPRAVLPAWLASLHRHLGPGARVVFIDNHEVSGSTTPIAETDAGGDTWQHRRLDDGSLHRVLKNFPTGAERRAAVLEACAPARPADLSIDALGLVHYWTLDYRLPA